MSHRATLKFRMVARARAAQMATPGTRKLCASWMKGRTALVGVGGGVRAGVRACVWRARAGGDEREQAGGRSESKRGRGEKARRAAPRTEEAAEDVVPKERCADAEAGVTEDGARPPGCE